MVSPKKEKDLEKGYDSSPESQTSTLSSDSGTTSTDSTSPPSTPPSPEDAVPGPLPRILHAPHSSTSPRRGRNGRTRPPASARLGAIDEDSSSIAPDIPTRNPNRKIPGFKHRYNDAAKFFTFSAYSRSEKDKDLPAPNAYDTIVGPRGEKFNDVRQNRPFSPPGRTSRRKKICLGLVILTLLFAIALGVGLGIGLTKKSHKTDEDLSSSPQGSNNDPQPFPLGTWAIPTYLATTNTSCTSNSATWLCYPYSTYSSSSPSNSFSTLLWLISSPSTSTLELQISNTQPTFSYPFTNQSLTLSNANDVSLSAFTFTFTYRKQVAPNADITGDGQATRCYYNNTAVSVMLYSNQQGAGGQITGSPAGTANSSVGMTWPYAIEYEEAINEAPECFRYKDGVEGERVEVAAGTGGACACGYRNYGLS